MKPITRETYASDAADVVSFCRFDSVPSVRFLSVCLFMECYILSLFYFNFFLGNAVLKLHTHFHVVYRLFATVVLCHIRVELFILAKRVSK